jgi:hypothetical protein
MTAAMEGSDEAATLRRLEEQLLDASVRASADQVAALIAEDFVEFGSSGVGYGFRGGPRPLYLAEPPDWSRNRGQG